MGSNLGSEETLRMPRDASGVRAVAEARNGSFMPMLANREERGWLFDTAFIS